MNDDPEPRWAVVLVDPALAEHFQRVATYEARMAAGAEQRLAVDGLPNLEITVLYWDGGAGRWRASEVQTRTAREDEALPPLLGWIAERLTDRESAHLLRVGAFRLAPTERDAIPLRDFLHSAQVYQTDLAAGRITAGKVAASR